MASAPMSRPMTRPVMTPSRVIFSKNDGMTVSFRVGV